MDQEFRSPIDADVVRSRLSSVWQRLDIVDTTGSTNADLLARSAAGEDVDGAVLVAEYQNAGRGRHGRVWSAPPRAQLAMSVGVSAAAVPPEHWGWLPLLTGVAVVNAVRAVGGIDAGLKWPNDVLVGTGKLAGILAEVAAPEPVIVVGLGLNVTLTPEEAPDPAATSVQMLGSGYTDRNVLLAAILDEFATRIAGWRAARGADDALVAEYEGLSLTLGRRVRAMLPGDRQILGVAVGIDGLGRLRIDTGDDLVTISAGDVTHLRLSDPTDTR